MGEKGMDWFHLYTNYGMTILEKIEWIVSGQCAK
jgi:hypothetical protein